jgi:nucleoside phosphorylase
MNKPGFAISVIGFLLLLYPSANADTIAFFYALDKDFETLKAETQSAGQSIKVGSRTIPVLLFNSHRVYAVKMGSGAAETAISAQALLGRVNCDEAFSVGPIGGLSDKLKVGSWYRVGEIIGYQKGSWTKAGFQLSANASWKLTNAPPKYLPELFQKLNNIKVASGELFVASDNYRAQLRETTGSDAVDMNLFGLLTVCTDHHLPLVCWRVASDHADDNASDDFKKFVAHYDGAGGKAVAEIIKNLPLNPNSPDAYPNLRKLLSEPSK